MKRIIVFSIAVVLILIISVSTYAVTSAILSNEKSKETFYVGVTYGGDTVEDAKLLIDKVKDYTNLFILQGPLQHNNSAIDVIGDYAVNSDMNIMVYLGINSIPLATNWLSTYDGRWGDHFLGIYAIDEPGGKMLDGQTSLIKSDGSWLTKNADRSIYSYVPEFGCSVTYMQNGTVKIENRDNTLPFIYVTYYPNGTIAGSSFDHQDFTWTTSVLKDTANLEYTYDELWANYPIQTFKDAEQYFTDFISLEVNQTRHFQNTTLNVITADYGLYWYDYQCGYDAVLTEFCWNESVSQAIAGVRGAAKCYERDWGVIITWKYTQAPYLASGDEIYEQMCTAYENGAKYIVIFNYADDMNGTYGTLQPEHFEALQRFWNDVVKSPWVAHGGAKAEAAFVLPNGYGSGLRNPKDNIWGLWTANETDSQIWQHMQDALSTYGEKLDIIYEGSPNPVESKYFEIFYWNQTG